MAVKIRLARYGTKKRPFYRIVVADARAPRDGAFIERLGYYNPMLPKDSKERIKIKIDKLKYWLKVGAQATDKIKWFIKKGLIDLTHEIASSNPIVDQK